MNIDKAELAKALDTLSKRDNIWVQFEPTELWMMMFTLMWGMRSPSFELDWHVTVEGVVDGLHELLCTNQVLRNVVLAEQLKGVKDAESV